MLSLKQSSPTIRRSLGSEKSTVLGPLALDGDSETVLRYL